MRRLLILVSAIILVAAIASIAIAQTPEQEKLIAEFLAARGFNFAPARQTAVSKAWLNDWGRLEPTMAAFVTRVAMTGTPTPRATATFTPEATATRRPDDKPPSSFAPVIEEDFAAVMARMVMEKPDVIQAHLDLLNQRYDLADNPVDGLMMAGGRKAVQGGVRVKLPAGQSWDSLAGMTPAQIKAQSLWPAGFYPLPFTNHREGGMLFPQYHIDEIKAQTGIDLTRFDLDFVMPDRFPA